MASRKKVPVKAPMGGKLPLIKLNLGVFMIEQKADDYAEYDEDKKHVLLKRADGTMYLTIPSNVYEQAMAKK